MTPEAEALTRHYRAATELTEQLEGGEGWYRESRRIARKLAREHGVTLSVAAGVLAAISPRMRWGSNISYAHAILAGIPVQGVFSMNLEKAHRIMAGERPLDVLGGPKVRAFYRAIMGDGQAVVIDVWMLRAVGWTKKTLSAREYERVSDSLREAAEAAGIDPADFQAIVWTQVRGGAE